MARVIGEAFVEALSLKKMTVMLMSVSTADVSKAMAQLLARTLEGALQPHLTVSGLTRLWLADFSIRMERAQAGNPWSPE